MNSKIKDLFNQTMTYIREKEMIKRSILYVGGLYVLSNGVAMAIKSNLGISPINVNPFVFSEIFTGITMGMFTTTLLLLFILIEFLILRKKFKVANLVEILPSFIFGFFVDLSHGIWSRLPAPSSYPMQLVLLLVGSVVLSSGLVIYMNAKLINMPAEGIVVVIAQAIPNGTFPKVKTWLDITLVSTAIIISLLYFGRLHGIREGTLWFAINTGRIMPIVRKGIDPFLKKIGFSLDW